MNLSIRADGHVFDVLILDILSDRAVKIVNYARCLFVLLFHSGILFSVESIYMLFLNVLAYRCVIVLNRQSFNIYINDSTRCRFHNLG